MIIRVNDFRCVLVTYHPSNQEVGAQFVFSAMLKDISKGPDARWYKVPWL